MGLFDVLSPLGHANPFAYMYSRSLTLHTSYRNVMIHNGGGGGCCQNAQKQSNI